MPPAEAATVVRTRGRTVSLPLADLSGDDDLRIFTHWCRRRDIAAAAWMGN
jgi:hypothetical protein